MSKPVTIAALDATHFTLNGRSVPRVFLALAADDRDAVIVNSADDEVTYDVPLGSTVAGATPTSQAALIAALAPVVGGVGGAAAGGSGTSTVIPPGGGGPVLAPADFRVTSWDDVTTPGVTVFYAASASAGKTYTKTIDETTVPKTFGQWTEDV